MKDLKKYRGQFDCVVNLFTRFGYFSTDAKNKAVLKQLVSTLKPGGKIALHLINRDWLMTIFKPLSWDEENEVHSIEARKYEPETKYTNSYRITIDEQTGETRSQYHRIRLYSKPEMVQLMKQCGLKRIRVIGSYTGEAFSKLKSTHPIYIGEKS